MVARKKRTVSKLVCLLSKRLDRREKKKEKVPLVPEASAKAGSSEQQCARERESLTLPNWGGGVAQEAWRQKCRGEEPRKSQVPAEHTQEKKKLTQHETLD